MRDDLAVFQQRLPTSAAMQVENITRLEGSGDVMSGASGAGPFGVAVNSRFGAQLVKVMVKTSLAGNPGHVESPQFSSRYMSATFGVAAGAPATFVNTLT